MRGDSDSSPEDLIARLKLTLPEDIKHEICSDDFLTGLCDINKLY